MSSSSSRSDLLVCPTSCGWVRARLLRSSRLLPCMLTRLSQGYHCVCIICTAPIRCNLTRGFRGGRPPCMVSYSHACNIMQPQMDQWCCVYIYMRVVHIIYIQTELISLAHCALGI